MTPKTEAKMKILDILNAAWAIAPQRLKEIQTIYSTHFRGDKIDWKAIEARINIPQRGIETDKLYEIDNGVAVIDISGVLTKSMSFLSWLFGGSSMPMIAQAFRAAVADPQVKAVMLRIDSPGGTVAGTQDLAAVIRNEKGEKEVIAWSDGMIASAAYWVASAADKIYIAGDTVDVGSIGVVATHVDYSKQDEQWGEKWTEITAGKYKRIASSHEPLSTDGRAYIQDQVDHLYSVFVGEVARNRNISEEDALKMADGKIFIGKKAVDIGLVDGVSTYGQLINTMSAGAPNKPKYNAQEDQSIMNLEQLKKDHPEVFQAAVEIGRQEVRADADKTVATARAESAAAEQKRITDIMALAVPGHESIIESAIKDQSKTAGDVALQIVAAEKNIRVQAGKDAEADAAPLKNLKTAATETLEKPKEKETADGTHPFMVEVEKYQEEKKCTRSAAIKAIAASKPELHEKYIASVNPDKKN